MSKKNLSRRDFLKGAAASAAGIAAMSLTGGVGFASEAAASTYTPGTYTGTGRGMGEVKVTMTFTEESITEVSVDVSNETEGIGKGLGPDFESNILSVQSAEVDAVSGATVTSTAVQEAAQDAINQAMGIEAEADAASEDVSSAAAWRTAPSQVPDSDIASIYEADVVVCGHGYAGITACRQIAESGKSVILIEKQAEDSYAALGNEGAFPNLPWLLENGAPEIDPVEYFQNWQLNTTNNSLPGLMMKYTQNAGENGAKYFDRCTEEDYATFTHAFLPITEHMLSEIGPYKFWPCTISCYGDCNQTKIQGYNRAAAIEAGAQVLFGTTAEYLLTDDEGAVTGVVASDSDGNYIQLNAKAVVLSTGGFGANQDMQKDLLTDLGGCMDDIEDFTAMMDRDGRGLQMAYWVGGKLESFGIATMNGKHLYPGDPQTVWLNPKGKRYMNEFWGPLEFRGRPALFMDKQNTYYSIYDDNFTEYMEYVAPSHGSTYPDEDTIASTRSSMDAAYAAGAEGVDGAAMSSSYKTYSADTLEELIALLGVSDEVAANMIASIERYNTMCENGKDEDFGRESSLLFPVKQAPFYCRTKEPSLGSMMCTCGGLMVNEEQQVMGDKWQPIPGLFASGNTSGGRFGSEYFTPTPGVSLGVCITLGFECGKSVVKYLDGEI